MAMRSVLARLQKFFPKISKGHVEALFFWIEKLLQAVGSYFDFRNSRF
jgi:hypothetical protein